MRAKVALAAVAALLAGCGDDGDEPPVETTSQAAACELYLSDQPVFLRFAGERAAARCDSFSAGQGAWSRARTTSAGDDFRRVCVLYQGRSAAGLYAAGGIGPREEALQMCSTLLERGWRELSSPADTPGWEARIRDQPPPDPSAAVRCSEGLCEQGDGLVARPSNGARCGSGRRWTFELDTEAAVGVFRCRAGD